MQRRGEERTKVIVRGGTPDKNTGVVDAAYHVLWKPDTSVPVAAKTRDRRNHGTRGWRHKEYETNQGFQHKPFGPMKSAQKSNGSTGAVKQLKRTNKACLKVLYLDAVSLGEGLLVRRKTQVAPVHQDLEGLSRLWWWYAERHAREYSTGKNKWPPTNQPFQQRERRTRAH